MKWEKVFANHILKGVNNSKYIKNYKSIAVSSNDDDAIINTGP